MKIIHINSHLFDVFIGEGWTNWSRFSHKNKIIHMVGGKRPPPYVINKIMEILK